MHMDIMKNFYVYNPYAAALIDVRKLNTVNSPCQQLISIELPLLADVDLFCINVGPK